jgi:murein DD-endopeptidase MepM/ murein hydrolase activator NlpD
MSSSRNHGYRQGAAAHASAHAGHHSHSRRSDYTLGHAGRQVRVGPVAFWIVVGTLLVMGVWSVATGTYFAFRENVLTRLIGRQADMQFAYEDRIAELRAQVDRIASRQLLDQEQFEKRLETLLHRQASLEARTSAISSDLGAGAPVRSPRHPQRNAPQKPAPLNETSLPGDTRVSWSARGLFGFDSPAASGGLEGVLNRVTASLDKVEQSQTATLNAIEDKVEARTRRMRGVLAELGGDLGKHGGEVTGAIGGPFVAAKPPPARASSFEKQLYRIKVERAQMTRVSDSLLAVPLRKPVFGDIDMSSPFGMRMDPFLRGPAIHTGIDLRGDTGDPVRATANGTVTIASMQGGYGNMVEIDHHNGFSTRYGHMSKIEVKVGQKVRIGDTLGRIGSTGRSTGPHLHYETRVNDTAVDPQKFFRAGDKLGELLNAPPG